MALERYQQGNTEGAVEIMEEGFNAFSETLGSDWYMQFASREDYKQSDFAQYMDFSDFIVDVNDYGFFLEQTGRAMEAVTVLREILLLDPDRVVVYLNLADALWRAGDTEEAESYYNKYASMMQKKGLSGDIPDRVWERVGE